jgi:hypothetical protein
MQLCVQGEKQQGLDIYSRTADIVTMAWQPRGGALAVGWSDGMLTTGCQRAG